MKEIIVNIIFREIWHYERHIFNCHIHHDHRMFQYFITPCFPLKNALMHKSEIVQQLVIRKFKFLVLIYR